MGLVEEGNLKLLSVNIFLVGPFKMGHDLALHLIYNDTDLGQG